MNMEKFKSIRGADKLYSRLTQMCVQSGKPKNAKNRPQTSTASSEKSAAAFADYCNLMAGTCLMESAVKPMREDHRQAAEKALLMMRRENISRAKAAKRLNVSATQLGLWVKRLEAEC